MFFCTLIHVALFFPYISKWEPTTTSSSHSPRRNWRRESGRLCAGRRRQSSRPNRLSPIYARESHHRLRRSEGDRGRQSGALDGYRILPAGRAFGQRGDPRDVDSVAGRAGAVVRRMRAETAAEVVDPAGQMVAGHQGCTELLAAGLRVDPCGQRNGLAIPQVGRYRKQEVNRCRKS